MSLKYMKKPVVIEALQWTGDNIDELAEFMGELFLVVGQDEKIRIHTLEGPIWANLGDYIIRGVQDEYYPCKPDIFALTYEKA